MHTLYPTYTYTDTHTLYTHRGMTQHIPHTYTDIGTPTYTCTRDTYVYMHSAHVHAVCTRTRHTHALPPTGTYAANRGRALLSTTQPPPPPSDPCKAPARTGKSGRYPPHTPGRLGTETPALHDGAPGRPARPGSQDPGRQGVGTHRSS